MTYRGLIDANKGLELEVGYYYMESARSRPIPADDDLWAKGRCAMREAYPVLIQASTRPLTFH